MSDEPAEPAWIWQGFEGPAAAVAAHKLVVEPLLGEVPPRIGAVVPEVGLPPMPWNVDGTRAMFAVAVRVGEELECPEGLEQAVPSLVGRLVNA